jgi:HNH endonuclease
MLIGFAKAKRKPIWIKIDASDWWQIGRYKWWLSTHGYAERYTGSESKRIFMHHAIIGRPPKGLVIDHINRNRLDNRRANLRFVPTAINVLNSDRSDNAKHAEKIPSGRWRARIRHEGKDLHLGVFDTKAEAMAVAQAHKQTKKIAPPQHQSIAEATEKRLMAKILKMMR